jgi:hypothetical protein
MRAFTALVMREISERRALLAAAAVASLLPILAPLLPATGSNPASDIREAVMWIMVGCLVPLFALLLGVSFIGRDLAEGRLGFYFAQPLSGPTIWFGKLTAVVLLVWATNVLIMLPTVLLSPDPLHFLVATDVFDPFMLKWVSASILWVGSVAVVLLAHTIGIVWRARSAWLVADLIALLMVVGVGWLAVSPFLPIVAPSVGIGGVIWIVTWTLVGLMVGGAVQVSIGRVDLRRCHYALSATLWTVLVISTATVFGWSLWIRSATLKDLDGVFQLSVGSGEWIAAAGVSDGRFDYYPRFLCNIIDGRSLSIGPATIWQGPELEFSADGSRAVWSEFSSIDHWPLMYADLDVSNPKPVFSGVVLGNHWDDFSVSPDGKRFATLEDSMVAVYQIDNQEQLMAVHIDEEFNPFQLRFDDSNFLRILASSSWRDPAADRRWHLFHVDIAARSLVEGAELDTPWRWWNRSNEGRADHHLTQIKRDGDYHLVILSPETGETVTDLGPGTYWSDVRVMSDGRTVVIRNRNNDHHLEVYSAEGSMIRRIQLPDADEIYDGGEVLPDRLLIGLRTWEGEIPDRSRTLRTSLVDLKSGGAEAILKGRAPVLGTWGAWGSRGSWAVGSVAGRLLQGEDGSLHLWDPETGELEQIIPVLE